VPVTVERMTYVSADSFGIDRSAACGCGQLDEQFKILVSLNHAAD
jgi:hypothetical protein